MCKQGWCQTLDYNPTLYLLGIDGFQCRSYCMHAELWHTTYCCTVADLASIFPNVKRFHCMCKLWQYGLWSFQMGGTKLERFLPKNQHTQRKLLNFENWVNGEVSKSAKSPNLLTFKVNFLYQKLSESFSIFFSLKNINLGAHFLLLTFFDNINF